MKKIIKLNSRYNEKNYLVLVNTIDDKHLYRLSTENHVRCISNDKKWIKLNAVDPSGGPFMAIGDNSIIKGYTITEIKSVKDEGIILTFKKESND